MVDGHFGPLPLTSEPLSNDRRLTFNEIVAANTITAAEIAATTITAAEIVSGTITTTQIATDTILADNIAAGAITASEIAAGVITASHITAGTITATEIAAGTITTTEIATDTIVAGNIAANAVGASEIATGSIVAGHIAAGTITADKITVTDLAALSANMGALSVNGTITMSGSGIFRTAASGTRLEITQTAGDRLSFYDATQTVGYIGANTGYLAVRATGGTSNANLFLGAGASSGDIYAESDFLPDDNNKSLGNATYSWGGIYGYNVYDEAGVKRWDLSGSITLAGQILYAVSATKTIASGAITITQFGTIVDTEGAAGSDNLDTINVTDANNQEVLLKTATGSRTVVVRDAGVSGGNIQLAGSAAFSMSSSNDILKLWYRASQATWFEISRSSN